MTLFGREWLTWSTGIGVGIDAGDGVRMAGGGTGTGMGSKYMSRHGSTSVDSLPSRVWTAMVVISGGHGFSWTDVSRSVVRTTLGLGVVVGIVALVGGVGMG